MNKKILIFLLCLPLFASGQVLRYGNKAVISGNKVATYKPTTVTPGFLPSDLDSLVLWLKADEGVILNGSTVSEWTDQSGNGNNAVQSTASCQPTYVTNALNWKPVLRFDGSNDFMGLPSGFMFNWPELSFFIVLKNYSSGNKGVFAPDNTYSTGLELIAWSGFAQLRVNNSMKYISGLITDGAFSISDFTYNNTATNGYNNGIPLNSMYGGAPLDFNGIYAIGRYAGDYGNYYAAFDVAEIIIYNTSLSEIQRQSVEQYLATKYGL